MSDTQEMTGDIEPSEEDILAVDNDLLGKSLTTLVGMIQKASHVLQDELTRFHDGNGDLKELKTALGPDLRRLVLTAIEQERHVNAKANARKGAAGKFALDLCSARAEIGWRLARLRRAEENGLVRQRAV